MSDKIVTVNLTSKESSALRLASIFGSPVPTPPEILSAREKLRAAEDKMKEEQV